MARYERVSLEELYYYLQTWKTLLIASKTKLKRVWELFDIASSSLSQLERSIKEHRIGLVYAELQQFWAETLLDSISEILRLTVPQVGKEIEEQVIRRIIFREVRNLKNRVFMSPLVGWGVPYMKP